VFPLPGWERRRQQQEMQDTHLASETDQTLQDNCMFACIHLMQENGWCPVKEVIMTHTNTFLTQQEQDSITLLKERMVVISQLQQSETEDLIGNIIRNEDHQNELGNTTPLINNLEMQEVFKDKNGERGGSVTDLINRLVDVLSLETQAV